MTFAHATSRRHCSGSIPHWIALLVLICAAPSLAQVDTSTPKAAVKSLYAAVQRADAAAIRQLLVVQTDPGQQLIGAYADMILAGRRLGDVVQHKFPGASSAFSQGTFLPEDAARIDAADVSIDGDLAKVKFPDHPPPITLQRSGGGWRIVVEESDDTPKHRADQLALLHSMTDALNKSADEIDADKYPTVEEAESAVKDRMGAVV